MKKLIIGMMFLATGISFTSCKKDSNLNDSFGNRSTSAADYSQSSLAVVAVSGDITSNTTWTSGNVYEISGIVTVRNGATLTIEAGTYIKASANTPGVQNGVLVIAKDGNIQAIGTQTNPIVFTSRNLLDGNASTVGAPGDFGGVIILGNAVINVGDKLIEGLADEQKFHYGGSNNTDNRGNFQFVRIEYAGYKLAENVEVNGLTLGGVGSGTTIDHVQVSYGLDDGFEFFGGTVSPTYLVSLAADDDQFDFDNGFTGTIQYAIAAADKDATHSVSSGNSDSNGIESDNNAPLEDNTFSLTPKTHPIVANISIIGTQSASGVSGLGYRNGIRERRGSEIELYDAVVTGYPRGIAFDADANATPSTIANTSVYGFLSSVTVSAGAYTDGGGNFFTTGSSASTFSIAQPWYNTPGSPSTVNYLSTANQGGVPSSGADWTIGWTKFAF